MKHYRHVSNSGNFLSICGLLFSQSKYSSFVPNLSGLFTEIFELPSSAFEVMKLHATTANSTLFKVVFFVCLKLEVLLLLFMYFIFPF